MNNTILSTDEYAIAETNRRKQIEELEKINFEHWPDYLLLKWWWLKSYDYSENKDYEKKEVISKIPLNKSSFDLSENSETSKDSLNNGRWWKRDSYWTKEIDYILTYNKNVKMKSYKMNKSNR